MLNQTIEELLGGDGGLVGPIIILLVTVAKPHMMGVKLQDPAVGDGRAPDVAGDISQKIMFVRAAMFRYLPEDSRKRVVLAGCTSGGAGFRLIVGPKRSLSWIG